MGHVWAAYRQGLHFPDIEPGLDATEFRERFGEWVLVNYDAAWTMFAKAKGKVQPVGLALGYWSHPSDRVMAMDRFAWFPWASTRNRVESAVNFLVKIRHEIPMVGFARPADDGFFVALLRHGMIRRIGTSFTIFGDEPALVYETRTPEH